MESIYSYWQTENRDGAETGSEIGHQLYHNSSSVTDMLQDLDWDSLESRRVKIQLTLLFKVIQDLVDMPASTRTRANHTKKLRQISSRSDAYKFSFFPRTIPVWNSLPATVAEAPDLVSFKQGLSTLTF